MAVPRQVMSALDEPRPAQGMLEGLTTFYVSGRSEIAMS